MAVLAGKHTRTARSAQRVSHKTVGKDYTIVGDTVQIRSFHKATSIAAHHLCRMVVGHDVHDIVLFGSLFLTAARSQ